LLNPLSQYLAIGKLLGILVMVGIICAQSSMIHRWHMHYNSEHEAHLRDNAAHDQTVANYRAAADAARLADKANAERVKSLGDQISKERSDEYQKRIADARARAERLRRLSQGSGAGKANTCGAGTAPVSGVPAAAGGTPEAACKDRLPAGDALTATEQAIQLDELIKWIIKVAHINVNAGDLQTDNVTGAAGK
jgi:hypothetical protein